MMYVCSIDADRLNLELLSHIFVCSSEDLVSARLSIYLVVMATVLPGCHGDSVTWLSCRHWCVLHLVTEADAWTLAFLTVHHDGTVASVIVAQRAPLYLCSITLQLCTICGTSLKQVLILCGARGYAVLVTSFHWSMIVMSFRNLITIVTSALPSEQKNDFVLSNL